MKIQGLVAAPGVAVGPVFTLDEVLLEVPHERVYAERASAEVERARRAMAGYHETLAHRVPASEVERALLNATMELLDDPYLVETITQKILDDLYIAEWAVSEATEEMARAIGRLDDPYLSARSVDFQDLAHGILLRLQGAEVASCGLTKPSIVVGESLTTSSLVTLPSEYILGFVSEKGGVTSHAAIMAQTLGIPYLVGIPRVRERLVCGETVILDAEAGVVDIRPSASEVAGVEARLQKARRRAEVWEAHRNQEARTRDGRRVAVEVNMGSLDDLSSGLARGAEGVGLFRTEFFFMTQPTYPDEETQFALYKKAMERLRPRPLVVRTLDVGADKALPYAPMDAEENPALGRRGVRVSLDNPKPFHLQLRALIRAAEFGELKILLPMVSSLEELERVREMLAEERDHLIHTGVSVGTPSLGIMMETPSAVFMADALARHCDFFSIGTNDLTQYIIAADRTNAQVQHLFHPFHPAVLRAMDHIIQSAHEAGIPCAMCGALAAEPLATRLLIGMGLDAFSVPSAQIPRIKEVIRQSCYTDEQELAREVLRATRIDEVMARLSEYEEGYGQ